MAGFDSIIVLLGLLVIPALYLIYNQMIKKRRKAAIKFSNLMFVKSAISNKKKSKRDMWIFMISLVIIALMIIGFADPHIPLEQSKEGVNVVFVIDNSGSMLATDYSPNRLEAAKSSAAILLDSLNEKDHAGIVIFENGATTAAYLSPFKERVRESLFAISSKTGQTALGDGLGLGVDMATSIPNKKKIVILIVTMMGYNAGITKSPSRTIIESKPAINYTILYLNNFRSGISYGSLDSTFANPTPIFPSFLAKSVSCFLVILEYSSLKLSSEVSTSICSPVSSSSSSIRPTSGISCSLSL